MLTPALQEATGDGATALLIDDAVLLREAFHDAVQRSGVQITLESVDEAFDKSGTTEIRGTRDRRTSAAEALRGLVGDKAHSYFDDALSAMANVASKISEARARAVERTVNDRTKSKEAFESVSQAQLGGERALVGFFEAVHDALEELGGDELANRYFNLLSGFIDKFSLRYDLRRPCILCPTLAGMFTGLVRELDALSITDQNIGKRLRDFKEAVQDLRLGPTEGRVSNCVMKQVMFLEAVAAASGEVSGSDLAALCKALEHWPHPAVRQSLLNLYGFASDFPGVRHGTPSTGMKRDINMRDLVAMSILLTGFTPYLESRLSAEAIFGGSVFHARPIPPVAVLASGPASSSDTEDKPRGLLQRLAFWRRGR